MRMRVANGESAPQFATIHNRGLLLRRIPERVLREICAAPVKRIRTDIEQNAELSYAIIDIKSVNPPQPLKNAKLAIEKEKGRKQHIVVVTMEKLLAVAVHTVNVHPFIGFLPIQDTAKPLGRMHPANWVLTLIVQYALSQSGRLCSGCLLIAAFRTVLKRF